MDGDWYARHMYYPGTDQYAYHVAHYGDPKDFGFKDVIHLWKAENWAPEKLVKLYKDCGAEYFVAMANHHDNLDMWDSSYQPWNTVRVGPGKDILEGWSRAARKCGLPFGISIHASHAWTWLEVSQDYDGRNSALNRKGVERGSKVHL
jgi:alpha-L-fucosidase